jgi:hypothetical protein
MPKAKSSKAPKWWDPIYGAHADVDTLNIVDKNLKVSKKPGPKDPEIAEQMKKATKIIKEGSAAMEKAHTMDQVDEGLKKVEEGVRLKAEAQTKAGKPPKKPPVPPPAAIAAYEGSKRQLMVEEIAKVLRNLPDLDVGHLRNTYPELNFLWDVVEA